MVAESGAEGDSVPRSRAARAGPGGPASRPASPSEQQAQAWGSGSTPLFPTPSEVSTAQGHCAGNSFDSGRGAPRQGGGRAGGLLGAPGPL